MSEPAPDREEIQRLMRVAERELSDAATPGLSSDGSFEHAYAAALALATVVIRAEGHRVHGPDHHRKSFDLLGTLANGRWAEVAGYLQHCRTRRNRAVYDETGVTSEAEARELREAAAKLRDEVHAYLQEERPGLGR